MWGTLSDERMDLLLEVVAGPRQLSHSRVRVPRDSWPYLLSLIRDSLFVASYDSQGYGGGILPRLHTGIKNWISSK
jgi:hypothetical protein